MSVRELDLPFEKVCFDCKGFGHHLYPEGIRHVDRICNKCKGTGKIPINDIVVALEDEE